MPGSCVSSSNFAWRGLVMRRYTVWALSAMLLFSCAAGWGQQSAITQVVPLKLYRHHLIVVQGSIASLGKRNLVIDTGAYPSIIDRAVAKKLRLPGRAEELDAVNQTVKRTAVVVPSVAVGAIQVRGQHFLVDDLSSVSRELGVRIDGLIGLDVLNSSFRIDYVAKKIYFGPVAPLPDSAPLEVIDAKLCVGLRAGRQALHLLIDTGAERTLLFGSRVSWLSIHSQPSREFSNLAGHLALREISLDELQLGETDLSAQLIYVSEGNKLPPYRFDGFLSTSGFRQVAFDFERRQFSWMANDSKRDMVRVANRSDVQGAPATAGSITRAEQPGLAGACADGSCGRDDVANIGKEFDVQGEQRGASRAQNSATRPFRGRAASLVDRVAPQLELPSD